MIYSNQNIISIESLKRSGISYWQMREAGVRTIFHDQLLCISKKDLRFLLEKKVINTTNKESDANLHLLESVFEDFGDFLHLFQDYENEGQIWHAQKYSFFHKSLILRRDRKVSWINIFRAQYQINVIYYSNKRSFYHFTEDLNQYNLESKIRHYRKGKSNESRYGIHEEWIQLEIEQRFKENLSYEKISFEVSELTKIKGLPTLSASSVSNRINRYHKNLYSLERRGKDYVKQYLTGYELRKKPDWAMQVAEADGSKYQVACYDFEKKAVVFLWFYVIMDVHSGKIIGAAIGLVENTELVLNAFYDMMLRTGHMPSTVIFDKSTPHQSNEFKRLKKQTKEKYGCLWLDHLPDDPQIKGNVEKFFQDFHNKIVSEHPDYIGLSISATKPEKRIKREVFAKVYKKKNSLLSVSQMTDQLLSHLGQHNTKLILKENISHQTKFEKAEYLDARPLEHHQIAQLIWKGVLRSYDRQRIKLNNQEYELNNFDQIMNLSDGKLFVHFNKEEPKYVYAFTQKGEYVGKANKKPCRINDPKHLSSKDRSELKNRKKARKATPRIMAEISKSKTKRLEKIRSKDPIILNFLDHSKERSLSNIISLYKYQFGLNEEVEENEGMKTNEGHYAPDSHISEGKRIHL